jgi:hypothetical protein
LFWREFTRPGISATPYIYVQIVGLGTVSADGQPRPIHRRHGIANISGTVTRWVKRNLINCIQPLGSEGWREEATGLHEREFIETRRHWFNKPVLHDTQGALNVMNLVEGDEAVVESPQGAFEPFVVHYAETFIIPANVGAYIVRPLDAKNERQLATLKAFVRASHSDR